MIFFKSLADYSRLVQGLDSNGAILVEALVCHEIEETEPLAKKRRKTEDEKKSVCEVTHSDLAKNSPLVEAFMNSVTFYDLLATDQVILNRLQNTLRPPDNVIFPFFVDIAIYQGRFKEALSTLNHIHGPTANNLNPVAQCRFHIKAAALCHATGNHQSMTDQVPIYNFLIKNRKTKFHVFLGLASFGNFIHSQTFRRAHRLLNSQQQNPKRSPFSKILDLSNLPIPSHSLFGL